MDPSTIRNELIAVLKNIQALSGEACPTIDDSTRPIEALPKFTSKVWPVATGMLGIALGKPLPCEVNIFVDEDTKKPLAIEQIIVIVSNILEYKKAEKATA